MRDSGLCQQGDIGPGRWLVALAFVSAAHGVAVEWLTSHHTTGKPPSTMLAIEATLLAPTLQSMTDGPPLGGEPAGAEPVETAPQEEPPAPAEPEPELPAEPESPPDQIPVALSVPPPPTAVTKQVAKAKVTARPRRHGSAPGASADGATRPASGGAATGPRYDAAYLSNPAPPYPAAARRRNVQGKVLVYAVVAPSGACARAEIRHSSGHPILDEAALQAVRAWRFVPATRDGQPVAAGVEIPIVFRLEG